MSYSVHPETTVHYNMRLHREYYWTPNISPIKASTVICVCCVKGHKLNKKSLPKTIILSKQSVETENLTASISYHWFLQLQPLSLYLAWIIILMVKNTWWSSLIKRLLLKYAYRFCLWGDDRWVINQAPLSELLRWLHNSGG